MTEPAEGPSVSDLSVSQLVKTIRERDGLSLEGLGRLMGVSYVTVSHWQSGRRVPQARHLRRLRELARNDIQDVATHDQHVLVVAPKADAAAVLAHMVRDAAAVLGVEVNVNAESDGMRALVKIGALKPAVVFVAYPMPQLDVTHLLDGVTDVTGAHVDLFVVLSDGKTPVPVAGKDNVLMLTTPITLGSIGEALRTSGIASPVRSTKK